MRWASTLSGCSGPDYDNSKTECACASPPISLETSSLSAQHQTLHLYTQPSYPSILPLPSQELLAMGNLCGKESGPDPFSQPGRTLASVPAPAANKISSVPKKVGGPPRTLGASSAQSNPQISSGEEDARRKAAAAAAVSANLSPSYFEEPNRRT